MGVREAGRGEMKNNKLQTESQQLIDELLILKENYK